MSRVWLEPSSATMYVGPTRYVWGALDVWNVFSSYIFVQPCLHRETVRSCAFVGFLGLERGSWVWFEAHLSLLGLTGNIACVLAQGCGGGAETALALA